VTTKVHLFQMRACFSGACFVQAHTRETQQAFLEGHVAAFEFFGGVFGLIRYDNLGSAVKRVLRGRRRVETDRFVALRPALLPPTATHPEEVQETPSACESFPPLGSREALHGCEPTPLALAAPIPSVPSARATAAAIQTLGRRFAGRSRT
jgi:hypothetical protein